MKFSFSRAFFGLAIVVALVCYPVGTQAQSIKDGLGGHWTFDKKDTNAKEAKDVLGEHHGEIKGKPKTVEGVVDEALSFNGKEDYVIMGKVTKGQDLTYAMWIKVDKLPGGPKVIIWDDDSKGGGDSWLELLADGTVQTQRGGDGFGVFKTTTPVKAGEWTHLTFVAEGKKDKKFLYINGELDAEAGGKINNRDTTSHVVVAVGHDSNAFIKPLYFDGAIDNVAIYLRALSKNEVKDNYAEAAAIEAPGKLAIIWGTLKTQ